MEGIRGTAGARPRRPLVMLLQLLQAVLLWVVVAADPLASHTFVPPFSEVQVDGQRLVSTYVGTTLLVGFMCLFMHGRSVARPTDAACPSIWFGSGPSGVCVFQPLCAG